MNIGIIGCGNISSAYFRGGRNCTQLRITKCADLQPEAARARALEFGCEAVSVDALLADPEIGLVINLTTPQAHVPVGLRVVEAGKHVYLEKPLAVEASDGRKLLDAAREHGVRVGCAPDTFLGGGIQTARKLVDEGVIGKVVAATAFMGCHGHESWHPNPAFYYDVGGGPMLDMGPYYLHALVNLLGPVASVSAMTGRALSERVATAEPIRGKVLPVRTDTHLAGTLRFAEGAIATMIMSFDLWKHDLPKLSLYGTEGSLSVPDPNHTGGPVKVALAGENEWSERPLQYPLNARMIGVVDMVQAIRDHRPHRASGELAQHVLEVMVAFEESSRSGSHLPIRTSCQRPAALPPGLAEWQVD